MKLSEDKLAAARRAFPLMPESELPDAIMRAEEHGERMTQEKEERRRIYRESRQDRIKAGKPEIGDFMDDEDIVCPHCGHWSPQLTGGRRHNDDRFTEITCGSCKQTFGLRVKTTYTFTTFRQEEP